MYAPTFTDAVHDTFIKSSKLFGIRPDKELVYDVNLISEKLAQTLDKGMYGADRILDKIGISDPDAIKEGKIYNIRRIFEDKRFLKEFINDVLKDSRFKNPRKVLTLLVNMARRA